MGQSAFDLLKLKKKCSEKQGFIYKVAIVDGYGNKLYRLPLNWTRYKRKSIQSLFKEKSHHRQLSSS